MRQLSRQQFQSRKKAFIVIASLSAAIILFISFKMITEFPGLIIIYAFFGAQLLAYALVGYFIPHPLWNLLLSILATTVLLYGLHSLHPSARGSGFFGAGFIIMSLWLMPFVVLAGALGGLLAVAVKSRKSSIKEPPEAQPTAR